MKGVKGVWIFFVSQLFLIPSAATACVSCGLDYSKCSGFLSSDPTQCGQPSNCYCVNTNSSVAYLDAGHPGLIAIQSGGRFRIAYVVYGSPASMAGILPGDELLLLNGKRLTDVPCAAQNWESRQGSGVAMLTLRRGNEVWEARIRLVPVRKLLEGAWNRGSLVATSVSLGSPAGAYPRHDLYGPYMLGIGWEQQDNHVLVTEVLSGTPAFFAGISAGDRIVAIDGTPVGDANNTLLLKLLPADHRFQRLLIVERGNTQRTIWLTSESITKILRQLDPPAAERGDIIARQVF